MSAFDVDVCVVGAGFAGLAAARHAVKADRSVAVSEARDRAGGRVHSSMTARDGLRLDVGGAWLGVGQDALAAMIADHGLSTYPTYMAGNTALLLDGRLERFAKLPKRTSSRW